MVKLEVDKVKIMCDVNKHHIRHVACENNRKVQRLVLNKELICYVQSAILWHTFFSSTLLDVGFTLNPCDMCVANKVIDGEKCTIVWNADYVNALHEDKSWWNP